MTQSFLSNARPLTVVHDHKRVSVDHPLDVKVPGGDDTRCAPSEQRHDDEDE